MSKLNLRSYQEEAVNFIKSHGNCILADEMGLGKTPSALCSMDSNYGHIVVCPTQVVYNWQKEGLAWRPELNYKIINKKTDFVIPGPKEVILVSYGMLPEWLAPDLKNRLKRKNENISAEDKEKLKNCCVVFDEIHRVSNKKSKQGFIAFHLVRLVKNAIGLTGTPIRNRPTDLWNILHCLKIEDQVFKSYFDFVASYHGVKSKFGFVYPKNPRVSPVVSEKLKKVMLRRLKEDVLDDLPDRIFAPIYLDLEDEMKKEFDNAWDMFKSLNYENNKIPDFSQMMKEKMEIAISNIPKMVQVVEEYEEDNIPLIVASDHKDPIEELRKRDGWGVIAGGMSAKEKFDVAERFQAGKLKGIGIVLSAGSEGLNLTYSSHVLFNDRSWVPAINEQFIARIDRIGQKARKLFIKDLIRDHALTKHIYEMNFNKMILSSDSIENNEGFETLKSDKEKESEKLIKEVILSCLPSWILRFNPPKTPLSKDDILPQLDIEYKVYGDIIKLLKVSGLDTDLERDLAVELLNLEKNVVDTTTEN